jgi:hypothetical protein
VEVFEFGLKLVSDIDRVAKRNTDSLAKLEGQGKKTKDVLGKQFEKVGFAAARDQKKQQDAFAASWNKIGLAAAKAQERAIKAHERAVEKRVEKLQDRSLMGGIKEGLGTGKLTSAAFYGAALAEGAFRAVDIMIEGIHKVVEVFTEGVARAFEESGKQQTLRLGERLSLGGKGGKEYAEDVGRFSKLTGFDDDLIRQMLLPARRAGMSQQSVRTAFAAASDVAAGEGRGGDAARVQGLLETFTKIQLKGGVTERMLPELGVAVKPFFADIAKQLKISPEEAKKRAEEGKINPQLLLNTIYKGIEAKQGGKLGTGAIEYSKTFESNLAKVKNLPNEYLKNLVDSPEFGRANELLRGLLENLDPDSPAGKRIMDAVEHMFERITSFIGDPKDAADSLADKVEDLINFSSELIDDFRSWADALIPSLETMEDMVFALRKMKAAAKGSVTDMAQVAMDEAKVDQKRNERMVERQLRTGDKDMFDAAVQDRLQRAQAYQNASHENGPIYMPAVEKAARQDVEEKKNRIRAVTINVHPGAVAVHAAGGDDPDKSHHEAGVKLQKHITRELEKAAQEGGG